MKKIFVCSPLRGDIQGNQLRAEQYCKYVYQQGHIPFAPHLFFTRFLDDNIDEERRFGIAAGMEFLKMMDECWIFSRNISSGMKAEIDFCRQLGIPVIMKGDI